MESHTIAGMSHGTPIAPTAPGGFGAAGPYMIEAGISSTAWIIESWGLQPTSIRVDFATLAPQETAARMSAKSGITAHPKRTSTAIATGERVNEIINGALRAAGLLR
jgi:hypothetical protein